MTAIMVLFHCESNPGFAASSHEFTFLEMARRLVGDSSKIHFAYRTLENGISPGLSEELTHFVEFDSSSEDNAYLVKICEYIAQHQIEIIFGFDQPLSRPVYKLLRRAGVRTFVSYWGAPMSSINKGLKLLTKRLSVALTPYKPDHFVFQSEGMRQTATHGRGIPVSCTSIVRTGIDTDKYCPDDQCKFYAHDEFGIPRDRKIIFFSGHMEARKGISVIIKTASELINKRKRQDAHFLLLGNKDGQESIYTPMYMDTPAADCITFGGYRADVPRILKSCTIGFIASNGWDSFPMSSIEMAATELPLLVSDLEGLREAVTDEAGFTFPVDDYCVAADKLTLLLDDSDLCEEMGKQARLRVLKNFSRENQIVQLEKIVRQVAGIETHGDSRKLNAR